MENRLIGLYASLDALLDTRLGTIAKVFGDEAALTVLSQDYHTRIDDKFPSINQAKYKKAYAARDTETLGRSVITGAIAFLQTITQVLLQQALARPYHDGVKISVNVFPYQLDEEERKLVLLGLHTKMEVFGRTGIPFELEVISMSDEQLTPNYCKENFAAMLMYDYEHWFQVNQEAFIKKPAPEVTLYVPKIYFVETPTEEDIEFASNELWHPFVAIEKTFRGWIDLQFIDVEYFSVINPK